MKKNLYKISTFLAAGAISLAATSITQAQTISFNDYSILPESVSSTPDTIPNILIVLDNSSSIRQKDAGEVVGGFHPQSRSYQTRKILREIISDEANHGNINIGLMELDMQWAEESDTSKIVTVDDCGDLYPPEYSEDPLDSSLTVPPASHTRTAISATCIPGDAAITPLWKSTTENSARGRLRENVSMLDADKAARMINILGIEPEMPDVRCSSIEADAFTGLCFADQAADDEDINFNPVVDQGDGTNDEDYRTTTPSYQRYYSTAWHYLDPTDGDLNGTPDMAEDSALPIWSTEGATTFGALVSAQNYLRGNFNDANPYPNGNGFLATLLQNNANPVAPLGSSTTIADTTCSNKNYIILITDGLPELNILGEVMRDVPEPSNEFCRSDNASGNNLLSNTGEVYPCLIDPADSERQAHVKSSIGSLLWAMREGYKVNLTTNATGYTKTHDHGYGSIETMVFATNADELSTEETDLLELMANAGSFNLGADGDPDISNPRSVYLSETGEELKTQLLDVFGEIVVNSGSASGISVIAESSDAAGSVVQAIYNPKISGDEDDPTTADPSDTRVASVSWTGTLSAFFLDRYGYLREDKGVKGQLEDYTIDKAFTLDFNTDNQTVEATYLNPTGFGTDSFNENPSATAIPLADITPIWEASEILSSYAQTDGTDNIFATVNRDYGSVASLANGYRRIYSWLQTTPGSSDLDGEQLEFIYSDDVTAAAITPKNYGLLAVADVDAAKNVVNFIRGEEGIPDFRNRTIDDKAYLLGDIVHSTAVQIDAPRSNFDTLYNDRSYTLFKEKYRERRRMVYVGGNDGLLHAFNGGFWDGETLSFSKSAPDGSDTVEHELGAEMWAYAPMNLLPHLQFLTRSDYNSGFHVAYVDGPVSVFDVKAFNEDTTHVNGWGSILVVGMRLGGGEFADIDPDSTTAANATFTARSAYIIIDVTDPSQEPEVIGEITHEKLGFTLSKPTVAKEGDDYFLVFGSGPTQIATATSDQPPRLYKYKLNEGARGFAAGFDGADDTAFSNENGFVGNMKQHDWDGDYSDDAVYFGTIKGDETDSSGQMYRYASGSEGGGVSTQNKVNLLLDTDQPIVNEPLLRSRSGKRWVLFGTGRYLTSKDAENTEQNTFYGLMEPTTSGSMDYSEIDMADIVDVTDVEVNTDGSITNSPYPGVSTFNALRSTILSDSGTAGWKSNYPDSMTNPSAKNSSAPLAFKNLLFHTHLEPPVADGNQCANEYGTSFLNVVDIVTGTASYTKDFDGPIGNESGVITQTIEIGEGYAYNSYLFIGPDPETGKNRITIKSPLSTGEIADTVIDIPPGTNGRTSWREINL